MAASAVSCPAGVAPAQQSARTETRVSGANALISSALEMTQMSVHTPISSASAKPPSAANRARSQLPNAGLSKMRSPSFASPSASCQPSVPRI